MVDKSTDYQNLLSFFLDVSSLATRVRRNATFRCLAVKTITENPWKKISGQNTYPVSNILKVQVLV